MSVILTSLHNLFHLLFLFESVTVVCLGFNGNENVMSRLLLSTPLSYRTSWSCFWEEDPGLHKITLSRKVWLPGALAWWLIAPNPVLPRAERYVNTGTGFTEIQKGESLLKWYNSTVGSKLDDIEIVRYFPFCSPSLLIIHICTLITTPVNLHCVLLSCALIGLYQLCNSEKFWEQIVRNRCVEFTGDLEGVGNAMGWRRMYFALFHISGSKEQQWSNWTVKLLFWNNCITNVITVDG